jgi:hypothetical protein
MIEKMNQAVRTGQCKKIFGRVGWMFALVLFLMAAGSASAQLTSADIVGTVTDSTGASIPNATVTIVNLDTHETRTTVSSATGDYQVTLLPVGRYSVSVKAKGFKNFTTPELAVEAGDRARADAHMALGVDTETVTVEATTPLLQADNATVSSTVTAKAVQDLPLNGRNFVQLVQLVPGANEGPGNGLTSGGRPDDRRQTSGFSVNGQDNTLNDFTIDGIDDNERIIGAIGVRPDVEGINEITVQTNSYAPEAGRTAGGVVSIITRTGTNKFHGSAYEFFRNDIFDARNVLQVTGRKPELRQNQFGGSFGGPIIKDRTFFFVDYEGYRNVSGQTDTSSVPDQYEYDAINSLNGETPETLVAAGQGTAAYSIDPIALFYLKLFPAPNKPGCTVPDPLADSSCLSSNYTISPSETQFSNTYDVRVDHKFNANNLFFARYDYNKVNTFTPPALGVVDGLQISGGRYNFDGPATDYASQLGLGFTHIFSPRLLIDLRAAYTRINNFSAPLNYGANADTTAGFGTNMNFNQISNVLTPIAFGPFSDIGDGAYVPLQDIDNTFQYSGVVSYTIGNHQIRAGASLIRRQARNLQSAFPGGQYGFGLSSDSLTTNTTAQNDDNILASSLVGAFSSEGRNYDLDTPDYRTWEPSFFVQDSWKVNPKLTVLYGGRYDLFTPFTEAHGHISNFDYTAARNDDATTIASALQVANVNGVNANAGIKTDYSNFAPRIGFAYSLRPNTVLRGGYGLSYFPGNYTSNFDLKNAPFVSVYSPSCPYSTIGLQLDSKNLSSLNSACSSTVNGMLVPGGPNYDGTGTFDAGLPLPAAQTINSQSLSFIAEDPRFRSALIQQYNLQVEQQFGANVLTIGYVGNKGSHLPQTINDINVPLPGNSITGGASSARPLSGLLPNLSSVGWGVSEGISNYNALQMSFQRRFSKGLAFDGNYTWGKAMSNNVGFSEEGDQGAYNADAYDTHNDYGVAENNIANRFALSINYEFQYGKGWTGIKKQAFAGWEVNSIAVWQSGKPLTIVNGGGLGTSTLPSDVGAEGGSTVYGNRATPINSGGSDRPNMVASPKGPKTLKEYFNVNAFAPQPLGTIGNEVRNSISGPHFRHIDLSLFKDFHLTERYVLQFRAEAFDFTNTPNYYIPNNNPGNLQLGSSNFGSVTNFDPNYTPRQLQFALKLTF